MASTYAQEPLAVVGMGCRLPGDCNSPTSLWQFLERGGIANNTPPASRFNLKGHEDGSKRPKTMRSPGGMFLENIDPADVDAQFFRLSKAEATAMDPQQRQLLEVIYESLENAGITLESLKGQPAGCFVGSYACDYGDIQSRDPENRAPNTTVGIGRAMLSNRVSHFLDIRGPSMTIDTACSGSLSCLDVASRYLQTGEIDIAIVAGCNLYLSPEHCIDLSGMTGAASPSGMCHTFDAKADGYIKAEGVNAVILKLLTKAVKDNDPVRAVVRGSASNSDGWTAGIASPNSVAQAAATRQAYANARISDFNQTTYLECHGTGTMAGDRAEVNGVASVFCANRPSDQPLLIGSIKSNIGHAEPAAGISGLLKAILALENGVIPGNPTFKTPNPEIDFEKLRVRVSSTAVPWEGTPFRRASINSFGYGGSNVHVILDETSAAVPAHRCHKSSYFSDADDIFCPKTRNRPHLLVLSANDQSSLESYCKALAKHLIDPRTNIDLQDLAYTLSERRTRHFQRGYLIANSNRIDHHQLVTGTPNLELPRIGFVFTGQGAQWSQMGRTLIDTFPVCKSVIRYLDEVLQTLTSPPDWTLLEELTSSRTSEHLRQPIYSQTLCTALQLAISRLLQSWGVKACSVIGHSSGEIAAAAAAGFLTEEQAIKAAYYRGKAAFDLPNNSKGALGMLAVGLGADSAVLQKLLKINAGAVSIACVNSPESTTLSGKLEELRHVKHALQNDGYFVRLLQVDLAYHSDFIADVASCYEDFLQKSCEFTPCGTTSSKMFSSTTGSQIYQTSTSRYWADNMRSPVLFSQALLALLNDQEAPDLLIEIGPSNVLEGPIKQVKRSIAGHGSKARYHPTLKRGVNDINALLNLAGQLFLTGSPIKLEIVNRESESSPHPLTLVDLPNYAWNHSIKYWYESPASEDWRFRKYPHHDLLGSKIAGTSWHAPSWRKNLRIQEAPWLRDHVIQGEIVFPAAGYIAMALEAMYQSGQSRGLIGQSARVHEVSFNLRNIMFIKAIVLQEGTEQQVMLTLNQEYETGRSWYEFSVSCYSEGIWSKNCQGLIALANNAGEAAPSGAMDPFKYPTPAKYWYKAMRDVGYHFGTMFQPQNEIEALPGCRRSRASLSLTEPASPNPQSPYSLHPVAIDGCLQSAAPSLWQGIRSAVSKILVPAGIDYLTVKSHLETPSSGVAITSAEFSGVGSVGDPKNFISNVDLYDPTTERLLAQVKGLRYEDLDFQEGDQNRSAYTRLDWRPDVSYLSQDQLQGFIEDMLPTALPDHGDDSTHCLNSVIELFSHKKPGLKVVEINLLPDPESIWLNGDEKSFPLRSARDRYCLVSRDIKAHLDSQERFGGQNAEFSVLDVTKPVVDFSGLPDDADLVVIRIAPLSKQEFQETIVNSRALLGDTGYVLFAASHPRQNHESSAYYSGSDIATTQTTESSCLPDLLQANGFEQTLSLLPRQKTGRDRPVLGYLSRPVSKIESQEPTTGICVDLIRLSGHVGSCESIKEFLATNGIRLNDHRLSLTEIQPKSTVLVLDEIDDPILARVTPAQWEAVQKLVTLECDILWLTSGAQLDVCRPHHGLIHGMARTIRAEHPDMHFTTLDVAWPTTEQSFRAIEQLLRSFSNSSSRGQVENEYVERNGVISVSRIVPDSQINRFEENFGDNTEPGLQNLHLHPSCIRMMCGRPGVLDSLCFAEVGTAEIPLPDDFVEVDMYAAGLNYKDVAICLGIVPADPNLLGLEGAGIIRRKGRQASPFEVGQRVLVLRKGSFANRVQCPVEGVHVLPKCMSFEEAATLSIVYLTVIHSLFDLADIQRGQSVLIHSASGGVGIAAIQICQSMGADIHATVGSQEKRDFLVDTFGLDPDQISSSRDTQFATQVMKTTKGRGVDIVLNSLTGDLLDESWRLIADCGTMVELGKKDILNRSRLSMEPFARNASYRALDFSLDSITRPVVARLMTRMFKLISDGHIKPISPMKIFPYNDLVGAIRYMRGGSHMGKIVISRAASSDDSKVPIRAAPHRLVLRDDVSYLLIGGLRGLVGSLAVLLARHGAKHLVVMSRSGYDDDQCQGKLRELNGLGTECGLVQGDVSNIDDVRRAFHQSAKPIGGIVQGAMVLRDKIYSSMTADEFHQATRCKVEGSWNLHTVALERDLALDFFTLLSSISGVVGQRGQANYAAANTFLDSLAEYRCRLGLAACSVDLGVIEDVGYISERQVLADRLDTSVWSPINEQHLHRILRSSILQQQKPLAGPRSSCQMITGIPIAQRADSSLLQDIRFSALRQSQAQGRKTDTTSDSSGGIQALLGLLAAANGVDKAAVLAATIEVINRYFTASLALTEPLEPAKPLAVYGLDSLAALEFRNWTKLQLGVGITTMEVVSAKTLSALCEKVLSKMASESSATIEK